MNIRFAALGLAFAASLAFAQEAPKPAKAKAERAAMLQTLQRGKAIKGSREQYQHLPEVFAAESNAMDSVGAGGALVLETKGRLVLYRGGAAAAAQVARVGAATIYPTVVNVRTGTLGVLTGTLVVKPKIMGDAAAIAGSHGLETVKEYPQLRAVFYRVKANMDIADVAAVLQADIRVETAYPEIIEHVRLPK